MFGRVGDVEDARLVVDGPGWSVTCGYKVAHDTTCGYKVAPDTTVVEV